MIAFHHILVNPDDSMWHASLTQRCFSEVQKGLMSISWSSHQNRDQYVRIFRVCSLHSTCAACRPSDNDARALPRRRRRLDETCLELYPQYSRNVIQSWIIQGKVLVNDKPVLKSGTPVSKNAKVVITAEQPKYVCRAGLKLEAALRHFGVDPTGYRALDSGLSTGGFTDCLLQHGAKEVIGVDVGYGQVAEKIRTDERVTMLERTNLRHLRLTDLPGEKCVDLVTLDLSFISVLKVMETVTDILDRDGELIVLIKPQFEAGKDQVSAGGVVKDEAVRVVVVNKVVSGWESIGFRCTGTIESPIKGASSGNTEYLAHFRRM